MQRLAGLDLLRLAAAFSVLAFHYGYCGGTARGLFTVAYPEIAAFAKYGYLGVDLFFIISGFVITGSAEGRSPVAFARARALRLYPAHVSAMTLTALVIAAWGIAPHQASLRQWLANLTMFAPAAGQPYMDGAYWSITLELVFYAWTALLIWTGLFQRRLVEIVGVWLAVCLLNEAFLHIKALRLLALSEYGPMFASGILMYRIWRGDRRPEIWLLIAVAFLLEAYHSFEARAEFARLYRDAVDVTMLWLLEAGLFVMFAGALFASRWISSTPLVLTLGGLTYPLYLLHQNVGYIGISRLAPHVGRWTALAIAVVSVVSLAWLIFRLAEPAGRKLMRSLFARVETAAPALKS